MYKAVIFDFDGVIGNTMQDNFKAWYKAFEEYGVQLQSTDYFLLEGMGRFQIADFFINKYGLDPAILESVAAKKEDNYKKSNQFSLYEGVSDFFVFLAGKGIKTAIVTGASRERLASFLPLDIHRHLSAVVTSDDVHACKPDPLPYLTAVSKLGVEAAQCLVIENAVLGIRSAKAAGATCFALETTLDGSLLSEADEIFNGHAALFDRIKAIF